MNFVASIPKSAGYIVALATYGETIVVACSNAVYTVRKFDGEWQAAKIVALESK